MRYYIIAGEASGDLHGSNLIKGLIAEDENPVFRIWGGDLMQAAAQKANATENILVRHYREGAVMGFSDVVAKAGKLIGNIRFCKKDILEWHPDVVILIDYPGFNMKIAEFCHKRGIKVFYYIPPKTWASREGRNSRLRRYTDGIFIVFPFEIPYFQKKGIPFTYKGNPLIDAIDTYKYEKLSDKPYIALLPGSRKGEISRMMPVCMEVCDRLQCNMIIAGAPSRSASDYAPYIGNRKNVRLVFNRTYDILKFADAAIINSGTASLEAALTGTPQVVCWSTSAATYFIATRILRIQRNIKFISLGNLCLDKGVFRELIQDDFNADNVTAEVTRLLEDREYRSAMLEDYAEIRERLGGKGASRAIAKAMKDALLNV